MNLRHDRVLEKIYERGYVLQEGDHSSYFSDKECDYLRASRILMVAFGFVFAHKDSAIPRIERLSKEPQLPCRLMVAFGFVVTY